MSGILVVTLVFASPSGGRRWFRINWTLSVLSFPIRQPLLLSQQVLNISARPHRILLTSTVFRVQQLRVYCAHQNDTRYVQFKKERSKSNYTCNEALSARALTQGNASRSMQAGKV